jgi:RAP1 GTPase activating protein 1
VRHADTSTGTFSIFTRVINKFDVMFHVSTYIPFHGADAQQVERKRHLGNDVGLIIFKGGAHHTHDTHTTHTHDTHTHTTHTLPIAVPLADGGSGDDGFDPLTISSHFNHVFIVVQKVPNASPTSYSVSIVHKPGVKPHMPFLPFPATFRKGEDFRNFLLAKRTLFLHDRTHTTAHDTRHATRDTPTERTKLMCVGSYQWRFGGPALARVPVIAAAHA